MGMGKWDAVVNGEALRGGVMLMGIGMGVGSRNGYGRLNLGD